MLLQPARRSRLIAVLRRLAMIWGPVPVRTWDRSENHCRSSRDYADIFTTNRALTSNTLH
jgi:hypothetical protein